MKVAHLIWEVVFIFSFASASITKRASSTEQCDKLPIEPKAIGLPVLNDCNILALSALDGGDFSTMMMAHEVHEYNDLSNDAVMKLLDGFMAFGSDHFELVMWLGLHIMGLIGTGVVVIGLASLEIIFLALYLTFTTIRDGIRSILR